MHPIVSAKKSANCFSWKDLISKWSIPRREYPSYFKIDGWEGYLACHDKNLNFQKLVEVCKEGNKDFLSSLESDYLVFGIDEKQNELNIFNSVSGKFPFYFSAFNDNFIASTDFGKVVKTLPNRKLDVDSALDLLFTGYFLYVTDKTFIDGVYKLPPGSLLRVDPNFQMKIEPIIDADEFLENKPLPENNLESFRNDLIKKLDKIVSDLADDVKDFPIATDLSSGFDSLLINFLLKKQKTSFKSFSFISKEDKGDTLEDVVKRLAQKHDFDLTIFDATNLYPFVNKSDLEWNKNHFFPATHFLPIGLDFYKLKREKLGGNYVTFNGHGGDEIYMSNCLHFDLEKIVEDEINWVKEGVKIGIGKLFTKKALDILLDKNRFYRNKIYFSPVSTTALQWFLFPIYWQYGNWEISPFNNLSLIKFAMKMPKISGKRVKKHQLWQGRTDIFLPEQFEKIKKPFDNHLFQMFDKRREFLIKILKNSVLEKYGLIHTKGMIEAIEKNKSEKYFKNLLPIFISVIRLEIFFQK